MRTLNLGFSRFTDKGLMELARLPRLEHLRFDSMPITIDGARRIQEALPDCTTFFGN